jgi:hypothetical protein
LPRDEYGSRVVNLLLPGCPRGGFVLVDSSEQHIQEVWNLLNGDGPRAVVEVVGSRGEPRQLTVWPARIEWFSFDW